MTGHYDHVHHTHDAPAVIWSESVPVEYFIANTKPTGFYDQMISYEMFGYYPPGHHKSRGKGTWAHVGWFGLRLGLAMIVGGASGTRQKEEQECLTSSSVSKSMRRSLVFSMSFPLMMETLGLKSR